ncbi:MAG TPA: DUF1552 domain-containing protein [Gammaproteobacteria bacterium]|nr:DUF1552 domain-containing protein [Gammaproteobacteria bacterium]
MTFITKRTLPRRTFLRAAGATIALPMLDAMLPAFGADSAPWTPRLGFMYVGNGIVHKTFKPVGEGSSFELSPVLTPLAPLRKQLTVVSGLDHPQAENFGDGTGDHPRSSAAWLTGVHAWDRTRPGVEVKLATSADQLAADVLGRSTPVRSLELAVDTATQSACDAGDCFYVNTVSWRNETTPNLTENHPRLVFERLFGDGGSGAERLARIKKTSSILDSVREEARRLASDVGAGDKTKLDEYLDSVREIEQRIQGAEASEHGDVALPDRPTGIPASFEEHTKLMLDLALLGFRTDATRIFSMILAREVSNRSYPQIGVPDQHHPVSHHRNDPVLIEKKTKIDAYHVSFLGYLAAKMQATPEGDGTLLDQSLLMYGGGMGDGNLHRHNDLPCMLLGNLGGRLKTGQHVAYPSGTPMTNLLVSLLDKIGVPVDAIGDSTGRLAPDRLSA